MTNPEKLDGETEKKSGKLFEEKQAGNQADPILFNGFSDGPWHNSSDVAPSKNQTTGGYTNFYNDCDTIAIVNGNNQYNNVDLLFPAIATVAITSQPTSNINIGDSTGNIGNATTTIGDSGINFGQSDNNGVQATNPVQIGPAFLPILPTDDPSRDCCCCCSIGCCEPSTDCGCGDLTNLDCSCCHSCCNILCECNPVCSEGCFYSCAIFFELLCICFQ